MIESHRPGDRRGRTCPTAYARAATLSLMPRRRPMTPDGHPHAGRRRGARPRRSTAGLAVVVRRARSSGDRVRRPPVRDRPGSATRRPTRRAADPRHGPRHEARHLPGRHARSRSSAPTRLDDDAARGARPPRRPRPGRVRWRARRGHGARRRDRLVARRPRLAFTAEVDPPRFLVGPRTPSVVASTATAEGRGRRDADRARRITRIDWRWDEEGHLDRWAHLFVVDAPGGPAAPGDRRRLGRQPTSPGSRTAGPIAFAADRGPEADLRPRTDDLGRRRRRDPRAPTATEPREVLAPGGWATIRPGLAGRPLARGDRASLEPEPLDDLSPGDPARHRPTARGRRTSLAPGLDRPIGNWIDTDLNGWMVYGRHGPSWVDDRRIVATDLRSRPIASVAVRRWSRRRPAPNRRAARSTGESSRTPIAVARPGEPPVVATSATDGVRAMELMTVGIDDGEPARPHALEHDRVALAGRPSPCPRCASSQAPGAGGPIETWIASPAGAGDGPLPTVVDVHGGPLGAWAPAPHIEVDPAASRAGYRVVLPEHPRLGDLRRATGSGRSSATGAASMPPTSTPRSTTSSGSASPTRTGSA